MTSLQETRGSILPADASTPGRQSPHQRGKASVESITHNNTVPSGLPSEGSQHSTEHEGSRNPPGGMSSPHPRLKLKATRQVTTHIIVPNQPHLPRDQVIDSPGPQHKEASGPQTTSLSLHHPPCPSAPPIRVPARIHSPSNAP